MESWERLELIMKMEGLNKNSFSAAIGLSNNVTITRIINEHRSPSRATCEKIVKAFPKYNIDWLLAGIGEMIKKEPFSKLPQVLYRYRSAYIQKKGGCVQG